MGDFCQVFNNERTNTCGGAINNHPAVMLFDVFNSPANLGGASNPKLFETVCLRTRCGTPPQVRSSCGPPHIAPRNLSSNPTHRWKSPAIVASGGTPPPFGTLQHQGISPGPGLRSADDRQGGQGRQDSGVSCRQGVSLRSGGRPHCAEQQRQVEEVAGPPHASPPGHRAVVP